MEEDEEGWKRMRREVRSEGSKGCKGKEKVGLEEEGE